MKFNLTVTVEIINLNKKLRDICLRLTLIYLLKGTSVVNNPEGRMISGCEEEVLASAYCSNLKIESDAGDIYVISDLHLAAGIARVFFAAIKYKLKSI